MYICDPKQKDNEFCCYNIISIVRLRREPEKYLRQQMSATSKDFLKLCSSDGNVSFCRGAVHCIGPRKLEPCRGKETGQTQWDKHTSGFPVRRLSGGSDKLYSKKTEVEDTSWAFCVHPSLTILCCLHLFH